MSTCNYFRVTNYNNVQTGYYRWTGCTDIISVTPVEPLQTSYVCAKDLYVEDYAAPLDVVVIGLCPSITPTPSFTPTPTRTPVIIYTYNLWSGGYYQDVCQDVTMFATPSNVTIYTLIPFNELTPGDNVYGNMSLTIPPINANATISNGATFIQLSGTLVVNTGICG